MSSVEEKEENLQNEVIQVMRSYFDLEGYTTSFTRMCAREIIEALQEREMPTKQQIEEARIEWSKRMAESLNMPYQENVGVVCWHHAVEWALNWMRKGEKK